MSYSRVAPGLALASQLRICSGVVIGLTGAKGHQGENADGQPALLSR